MAATTTRHMRAARNLAIVTVLVFVSIGVLPSCLLLSRSIEYEFVRPKVLPAHVTGILTLGGGRYRLRLIGTYELSRLYPNARVVYSGGSGDLIDERPGFYAEDAKSFLIDLGLDRVRLTLEDRSRNTWENIVFTERLIKPRPNETWILATSALQMPRAMEIGHSVGWRFVPWPTDWVTGPRFADRLFAIPENLEDFDEAVREIIGRWAYRLSGKALAFSAI